MNGAALRLECNCRGDLALRHRDCVMKWVQVKGSNVCELCKAEIRNIPAPPPRPTEDELPTLDEAYFNGELAAGPDSGTDKPAALYACSRGYMLAGWLAGRLAAPPAQVLAMRKSRFFSCLPYPLCSPLPSCRPQPHPRLHALLPRPRV